jgi:Flp pilus assembly protein TadD
MLRRLCWWLILSFAPLLPSTLLAQFPQLGSISGQIRATGDFPTRQILVELRLRGGTVNSVYTDMQGGFSFGALVTNVYHVVVNDDAYYPADEVATVSTEAPNTIVHITLRPREEPKKNDPMGGRAAGGNPYLADPADYNRRFPKKAVKEYERGVADEKQGKHEDAIAHYQKALTLAPDYYPAHNNLGSLYLSRSDFKAAEAQFRETVRLDQNEGQAYFNLGNVLMLTGHYPEAEAALQEGLQRRPDSPFARFLRGCVFARTGKPGEAEKSLREALQMDPTMSQAHLQLVNLYLQQGRKEDAIHQLQDFLKAFPNAPTAAKARAVLSKLQTQEGSRRQ